MRTSARRRRTPAEPIDAPTVAAMPLLDISPRSLRGAPCLAVSGELDIAAVPKLEQALDAAIAGSTGAFFIDVCELEFLDSSGIRALLRARALLGREDRMLALVCPAGPVRRALDVVGVSDLFTIYASRADAAGAVVPPA